MAFSGRSGKEAKRQRREAAIQAKRETQRRREGQRRGRSIAIYGSIAVAAVVIVGFFIWSAARPKPGERIPSQGRTHISPGQAHPPYNSNPPTSGWHTPQTASWGAIRQEIPDEVALHNLEHGGIWISYRDASDSALVEQLETLASRFRSKILVTPRPKNDSRIAVAAWERLLRLDAYDEARIVEFIDAYRNRGPEQVPD